jgi:hypothetical protein
MFTPAFSIADKRVKAKNGSYIFFHLPRILLPKHPTRSHPPMRNSDYGILPTGNYSRKEPLAAAGVIREVNRWR